MNRLIAWAASTLDGYDKDSKAVALVAYWLNLMFGVLFTLGLIVRAIDWTLRHVRIIP